MLKNILSDLDISLSSYEGSALPVYTPVDGSQIASLKTDDAKTVDTKIAKAQKAFEAWRQVPAPVRGQFVRLLGEELRRVKEPLGKLVTLDCGKIAEEGKGEVQEMIDICEFAVGLSRQLYGLTIASERPRHVMQENWCPLGVVGVISAFNFPVAVWAWNAALAFVCGDAVLWKPSEKTPLTAIACHEICKRAAIAFQKETGQAVPNGLFDILIGEADVGNQLVEDTRVPLISATGSCRMGAIVGPKVAARYGKCILELGGNNAAIVTPSADLDVALPSIVFGAVGTAGQRCTSTRRIFVHESIIDEVFGRINTAYQGVVQRIGDPLDAQTLVGPLIDQQSRDAMQTALAQAKKEGGEVYFGEPIERDGAYTQPALVRMPKQTDMVMEETFAPILYIMPYKSLEQVMIWHNAVPQGLSSTIFTTDIREAEYFKQHSDCGIANVNIGTSGAEIGGAFGGEKATGGGRESGSDAWKQYMRRQTSTTYIGTDAPPLAQGISFG